jgi:transposase-like protein
MDDHLGSVKHDPARRDGGNSRNGTRTKQLLTDVGPVEVAIPRDRDGSFEPQIVGKRQRRLSEIDGLVILLSAKGLTHGEIAAHLAEVYDAPVSKQTISTITDRVIEGMSEWQNRPLDPGQFLTIVANPGRMGSRCLATRRTRCLPVSSANTSN